MTLQQQTAQVGRLQSHARFFNLVLKFYLAGLVPAFYFYMDSIEDRIIRKFGEGYVVVGVNNDTKRAIISDGKYEYCLSVKREIWAKSLGYDNMTYKSRRDYWQDKFPENIEILDIFKDGKRDPELLIFDKNNKGTYLLPFKYDVDYFLFYYKNYLKFKINRITDEEVIYSRYGDGYSIIGRDFDKINSLIITDGEYEWSVSCSWFRKTPLTPRTMTKNSYVKYHQKSFPSYIIVLDYVRSEIGYRYLILNDTRNDRTYSFNIESNKKKYIKYIDSVYDEYVSFYRQCRNKYGDKFSYEKTRYISCYNDIIVTCPIHGDIVINANSFLRGNKYGCPECGRLNVGYRRDNFISVCGGSNGILYVIEMYNKDERFIKIGITSSSVKKRFVSKAIPYEYTILAEFNAEGGIVYDKEKEMHKLFSKFKYKPHMSFGGQTECFDISIKQEAIDYIQNKLLNL